MLLMPWRRKSRNMREVHEHLLDRMRAEHERAPKSAEWRQLEVELEANRIDSTDLGIFSSIVPTTFDYEAAAPILVRWLSCPRSGGEGGARPLPHRREDGAVRGGARDRGRVPER
jgi:hypothetical protein